MKLYLTMRVLVHVHKNKENVDALTKAMLLLVVKAQQGKFERILVFFI